MSMQNDAITSRILLAFVGMPGSGKSEAAAYLKEKGFATVRFGQVAEDGLASMNLPLTPENEQMFREKIRKELGMAAFAVRSEERILECLESHEVVVIDGLYSWEEYTYLSEKFSNLHMVYVFVRPSIRYDRLQHRKVRPLTEMQARARDFAEIERLNKSGPIAMADYILENNTTLAEFHAQIDVLLVKMGVTA